MLQTAASLVCTKQAFATYVANVCFCSRKAAFATFVAIACFVGTKQAIATYVAHACFVHTLFIVVVEPLLVCIHNLANLLPTLTKIAHSIISVLKSVSCCALFARSVRHGFAGANCVPPIRAVEGRLGDSHQHHDQRWRLALRSVLVDDDEDKRISCDADRGATEWSSCGSWHAARAATDYQRDAPKSTSSCGSWHAARAATDYQRDDLGRESSLGDLPVGRRRASCHR